MPIRQLIIFLRSWTSRCLRCSSFSDQAPSLNKFQPQTLYYTNPCRTQISSLYHFVEFPPFWALTSQLYSHLRVSYFIGWFGLKTNQGGFQLNCLIVAVILFGFGNSDIDSLCCFWDCIYFLLNDSFSFSFIFFIRWWPWYLWQGHQYETVSGFVCEAFGYIPRTGESIKVVLERENQEDDSEYAEAESDRQDHQERFQMFKLEVCSVFQVAEI